MAETVRLDPVADAREIEVLLAGMQELLRGERAVFLATQGEDGYPDIRAMLNLRNPVLYPGLVPLFADHAHDMMLLFTTNTHSVKHAQIVRDPCVSVYVCRDTQFHGLRFMGAMEIVGDAAFKRQIWQPGWEKYYPEGPESEDYAVLRLYPRVAKYYHALQLRELALPFGGPRA